MTLVNPPVMRSSFTDAPDGFEVVIPAKRYWGMLVFLLCWLGGWTVGGFMAFQQVLLGDMPAMARVFMYFWLGGWIIGEGSVLAVIGWQFSGRERIALGPQALSISREIAGLARTKRYDLMQIRNLRVDPTPPKTASAFGDTSGMFRGALAFDYGAATIRLGLDLPKAEADQVLRALTARHAFR